MPWVIAIIMFLTLLAAAAGLALSRSSAGISEAISGRVTIQVVEANPERRAALATALRRMAMDQPYVRDVRTVEREEMVAMLGQWFGNSGGEEDAMLSDLPLPALIDVDLIDRGDAAIQRLRRDVVAIAPQARVLPHAEWLGPVARLIGTLAWLAVATVLLMIGATVAIVVLTARSALGQHFGTIEILHLIGATDRQITRLFQRRIAIDTAFGIALGTGAAALVMALVGWQFARISSGLLASASLGWGGWLLLLALPLSAIVVAALTARWTLMKALGQLL